MSFKRLKRAVLCVAAAAAIGASAALAGCTIETGHPRAEITLEFNGTQYVIEYTLYRNMYPQTVRHFIELAEAGFYDNTIIHDYASNDWYGGGYTYDETAYADAFENGAFDDYLNDSRYYKEDDYLSLFNSGALTPSVYTDYSYDADGNMTVSEEDAYHTLIGEFENNDHIIDNGQRSAEYGSLKMYYTPKVIDNIAEAHVYIKTGSGQVLEHDYEYNSATSLFAIQVGTSSSLSVSRYATFGYLSGDDDSNTLDDLIAAVEDYIDDEYNDSDEFVSTTSAEVDRIENIAEQATAVEYDVPNTAIVIRSVRIIGY